MSIVRRGLCLVLAAPSGAGKSSLTRALLAAEPALSLSISVTTRPPRPGELDGEHYHFRDQAAFDAQVAAGGFLEWARVLGRHSYGTPRAEVQAALAAGDTTPDQIVERVYAAVPRAVWPAARVSVRAQLDYLAHRGDVPPGVTW